MSPLRSVVAPLLWPWRWHIAGGITLNALHGFAITFQTLTATWLIDWVLKAEGEQRWERMLWLGAGYVAVSLFGRMLMWHLGYRIFTWVREQMLVALRARFFRQVNHLCLRFHMQRSSGELFSYLFGSPLGQIMQFYQHTSMHVAGAIVTLVTLVAATAQWDWPMTVVLLVTAAGSVVFMERSRRLHRKVSLEFQEIERSVTGTVNDLLRGTRAVKLYAMEQAVERRFDDQARTISALSYRRDVRWHMQWMQQEAFAYVGGSPC